MSSAGGQRFWLDAGREAELVIAAQRGDAGAFMELLRCYRRPLWRLCFALTRDEAEAAAVLTEAARRAWGNVNALPAGRPFAPWFVRHLMPLVEASASRAHAAGTGVAAFLAEPTRETAERHRLLREWAELDAPSQTLLALVLIERLPYADVAMFSGTLPGAVAETVARLRERIDHSAHPEEPAA